MVKTIFSCILSAYSLALNNILTMPSQFLISQFVGLACLIGYFIYLFIWVKPHLVYELYKIHNVIRVISVLVIVINRFGGIIMINII